MNETNLNITFDHENCQRLDSFLASSFSFSRNEIANNIKNGKIFVNKSAVKPSYKLKSGDVITGSIAKTNEQAELIAEEMPLDIIFENEDLLVINKPSGMPVHPGAGNASGTLVNYLLAYLPEITDAVLNTENDYERIRPGIIHRLDKDTSGVLIVAKNKKTLSSVSKQIKNRKVKKIYWALCAGWPKEDRGVLRNYIGRSPKNRKLMADVGEEKGKEAISKYKVLKHLSNKSGDKICLIEFNIKTGRTHQIRIQSKIAGFPVLGDAFYGGKENQRLSELKQINRQMLHAKSIDFYLPGIAEPSHFEAPLPKDFGTILNSFKEI